MMSSQRLEKDLRQAARMIPGGGSSCPYSCPNTAADPLVIRRAKGAKIWDVDDAVYTDYTLGGGTQILGHANRAVVLSAKKHAERGLGFGITTRAEIDLARHLIERVPSIQQLRFVNSGTEAVLCAIRLAQAVTGRRNVLSFQGAYHGFHGLVPAGPGAAEADPFTAPYNDVQALTAVVEQRHPDIACILVEPVATHMGIIPASRAFLQAARELSRRYQIILIFDEVMTGFRASAGCAHAETGIFPDLTCLGSVIGAGFPLGAYGGGEDIMQRLAPKGPVHQAGTAAANPVVLRAGMMALRLMDDAFYRALEQKADRLTGQMNRFFEEHQISACLTRWHAMLHLRFSRQTSVNDRQTQAVMQPELYARLRRQLFSNGIYFPAAENEPFFLSGKHSKADIGKLAEHLQQFFLKGTIKTMTNDK